MTTRPLHAAAPLALLSLVLTACGSAPMPGGTYPQEPTLATADSALDLLDRAETELRLALGGGPAPSGTATTPEYAQPPSAPGVGAAQAAPPPSPSVQTDASRRDETPSSVAAGPTPLSSDPCANACRALASMERATTHLCSLAGDADARCEGARTRVKNASSRVHAECPTCAGG
jgi:hypothetical protein